MYMYICIYIYIYNPLAAQPHSQVEILKRQPITTVTIYIMTIELTVQNTYTQARRALSSLLAPVHTILPEEKMSAVVLGSRMVELCAVSK